MLRGSRRRVITSIISAVSSGYHHYYTSFHGTVDGIIKWRESIASQAHVDDDLARWIGQLEALDIVNTGNNSKLVSACCRGRTRVYKNRKSD
jgi:hypothetical protein